MSKESMSIHRALAELKLIDNRISKGIEQMVPVGSVQGDRLVNGVYTEKDFVSKAKSDLQSVQDLIKRKIEIKSAIVKANGSTKVKIGGKKMTIADAISFKNIIELKKSLVSRVVSVNTSAIANTERNNSTAETNALGLAKAALGKDNIKLGDDDVNNVTESYLKTNTFTLVDPLKSADLAKELQNEIDEFEAEVDATLSEINAITIINI